MMTFRTIAAGLILSIAAPAAAEATDPAARITAYNEAIVAILKDRPGVQARRDRFEALVRDAYDMPAIAQLVVGAKWAASSAADRNAAIAALTRHSAVVLARNFVSFHGEAFVVDPTVTSRGASRIVRVRITAPGSSDTLLYVLRQRADGWRIIDVISEGVSQLAVQRSDFAATVAADGAGGLARRLAALDAAAR